MARCWRLIGHSVDEGTTYAPCAGTFQTSPYTPDFNGTLLDIKTIVGRTAATTLTDHGQVRLTSTTFVPNTIHAAYLGSGLQTAPAQAAVPLEFPCAQPVKSGVPITVETRNANASGVTNDIFIFGYFDVSAG